MVELPTFSSDPETESEESLAADYAELLAQVDQHEILAWDTQPGDAVVFHALTIHGATGNAHSKNKRRAYSMRFAGPDVRHASIFHKRTLWCALLPTIVSNLGAGHPIRSTTPWGGEFGRFCH